MLFFTFTRVIITKVNGLLSKCCFKWMVDYYYYFIQMLLIWRAKDIHLKIFYFDQGCAVIKKKTTNPGASTSNNVSKPRLSVISPWTDSNTTKAQTWVDACKSKYKYAINGQFHINVSYYCRISFIASG